MLVKEGKIYKYSDILQLNPGPRSLLWVTELTEGSSLLDTSVFHWLDDVMGLDTVWVAMTNTTALRKWMDLHEYVSED